MTGELSQLVARSKELVGTLKNDVNDLVEDVEQFSV